MTAAGRFQARLRYLTGRERALIAAGILAVVLFFVVRQLVFPRIDEYRRIRAAIPQRTATIARYGVAAEGEAKVDELLAERALLLYEMEGLLLPGDNPAAAGAALQGMLKPGVERSKMRLTSVRSIAPVVKGPYAEVAVQMDLQGSTEGMASFLGEIARQKKMLRVRKLTVSSGMYSQAMANRPELLTVTVEVVGMTDAGAEDAPEGEDE